VAEPCKALLSHQPFLKGACYAAQRTQGTYLFVTFTPGVTLASSSALCCAAGAAQQAPVPTAKPPRRLSFPSFARLRAFGRKSPDGCSHATLDSCQPDTTTSQHHPNRSLLGPRPTPGGSSSRSAGAPEPLSMSAVVYGAEAVRRGVDTLGVVPAAVASCWLTGADPLAAMLEEQQRLRQQVARQQEALATPLQLHEERALLEQYAALMRPSWAFGMAAFTQVGACRPACPIARPKASPPARLPACMHACMHACLLLVLGGAKGRAVCGCLSCWEVLGAVRLSKKCRRAASGGYLAALLLHCVCPWGHCWQGYDVATAASAVLQGAKQATSKEGPAGPPAPPGSSQGGMAPPAPQPGLAF
jgi:hypothetical protein